MANRKELIEAMKVIKEHCKLTSATSCSDGECPITEECNNYLTTEFVPQYWDLEESETE